jgi:hypothetical protein
MTMKKTNRKDQRGLQISSTLREIRLHALIFGGTASPTILPTFEDPKIPIGLGE